MDGATTADYEPLTERELLIAQRAAEIAVRKMTDEFYKQVGKGVIHRLLVYTGLVAVAYATGRGWIHTGLLK